jgi:CheY-like chemotaxis protein
MLKILLWGELILSLRILMFTVPVLINTKMQTGAILSGLQHNFIIVLTGIAFIYFVIGLVSLLGSSLYMMFHIIAALAVAMIMAAFYQKSSPTLYYYLPAFWAVMFSVLVNLFRKNTGAWKSILLVDDDETLIRTVRPILLSNGYSVLVATSGEEGLRVAKKQKPHLILLDVILPGIKGREVCRQIKSDGELKNIPVVFLTSKDSPDDVQAELAAGAQAHLSKPVTPKALLDAVQRFIS